jgi:steroid delta-isomerase-like uncharacterized protein
MSTPNKALIRRVIDEAVNKGNLAVIDELVAGSYVYREPTAGEVRGPSGLKNLLTKYREAFPDLRMTIEEQIAEGDVVVTRWTGRGTQRGELMGVSPTGRQVTITGVMITRISNGKIVEEWENYDALGMMRQLGAVAAAIGKVA